MLLAAVKNSAQGKALTRLLLEERGSEVVITEQVLLAALQNQEQSQALTKLLL